MVLTILEDPGFKPLKTCIPVDVKLATGTMKGDGHLVVVQPAWEASSFSSALQSLPQSQSMINGVGAWIEESAVSAGNDDVLSGLPNVVSGSLLNLNISVQAGEPASVSNSNGLGSSVSRPRISFASLPTKVRERIWTLHALDQPLRTVSTGSIIWKDGSPYDNNSPLPIHQICHETRAAKTSANGLHGYQMLHLSVITCTTPRSKGYAAILFHPAADLLLITHDFQSVHGAILPSFAGFPIMQDLYLCNFLSTIQHLALCCHDSSFPFLISQLGHFTNLRLLFLVTGTHYVKVKKGEEGREESDRFDTEAADKTIWYAPDDHSYLPDDFLKYVMKPFYIFREQYGLVIPAGTEPVKSNWQGKKPAGHDQDKVKIMRKSCKLPVIKVVSRVNWFEKQDTLRRLRDRMAKDVPVGSGHWVLSEARYGRVREGKEALDYFKRQVRGGQKAEEKRVLKRARA